MASDRTTAVPAAGAEGEAQADGGAVAQPRTEAEAEVVATLATLLSGFAYKSRVFIPVYVNDLTCTGCAVEHDERACNARPPDTVCMDHIYKEVEP